MPAVAPKGPKRAEVINAFSVVLHLPLTAFLLSLKNMNIETRFRMTYAAMITINRVVSIVSQGLDVLFELRTFDAYLLLSAVEEYGIGDAEHVGDALKLCGTLLVAVEAGDE